MSLRYLSPPFSPMIFVSVPLYQTEGIFHSPGLGAPGWQSSESRQECPSNKGLRPFAHAVDLGEVVLFFFILGDVPILCSEKDDH